MPQNALIAIRSDTSANWSAANPVLATKEIAYDSTVNKLKIGDGATAWNSLAFVAATASIADGDKGDITVSGSGATWTIDNGVVTLAKMADMATASVIYRKTAGTGAPEVQTLATLKTDLGLTGTNSGDQTSIVGITGTLAEFNTALTGADFATGGGTATGTNTGDQTSIVGITGTLAQFNTAITDGDITPTGPITTSGLTMATSRLLGRTTASTGAVEELTASAAKTFLAIASGDVSGLGYFATGTDAANLTGTVAVARLPAFTGGDVTSSAGSAVLTIGNGAVSLAKMADVATATVFYRKTAGTGAPEVQTLATLKSDLGLTGTNSGDQTSIVGITGSVAEFNTALTGADFYTSGGTDVALADGGTGASLTDPGADRLMFWDDSAGTIDWLTLGTNLSITGTTINATGGGVSDGDKGDVVVSGSGATWTVESAAGDFSVAGGDLNLTNGTSNFLNFGTIGVAAPTTTTRSVGTKVVLYSAVGASSVDYAQGVNSFTLWSSVPEGTSSYKFGWYGGTNLIGSLDGLGNLSVAGDITVNGGDLTVISTGTNANVALLANDAATEAARLYFSWAGDGKLQIGWDGNDGQLKYRAAGTGGHLFYNGLGSTANLLLTIGNTAITATVDVAVPDEAYDATAWNGSMEVPTKNAIRDKIETMGGAPGGSDRQIQYNNAGAFAGSTALDIDTNGNLRADYAATVTTPGADQITYAPQRLNASGGRLLPRWRSEDAVTMTMAIHQGRNTVIWGQAIGNATTAIAPVGQAALTAIGTATARNWATTNRLTRAKRIGYVSAGTAGSAAGLHNGTGQRQNSTGGVAGGGFFAVFRFAVSDASLVSGAHALIGMRNASAAPTVTANPNTLTETLGVAQCNGGANWRIVYGGSAAQTDVDTGIAITNTSLMELILYARPDVNNKVTWRLEDISTGSVASGELTGTAGTAIPANTQSLGPIMWRSNNATASAVGIDIVSYYIESDFG